MPLKTWFSLSVGLLLGALGLFFIQTRKGPSSSETSALASGPAAVASTPAPRGPASAETALTPEVPKTPELEFSPIAEALNSPDSTAQKDLQLLSEVLQAWRSNFHGLGNPVGDNTEITAALTGQNRLHFAFIRAKNPAINTRGELCDRWGTPYFFHAVSAETMELRSAGPDKTLYTADDITSQ